MSEELQQKLRTQLWTVANTLRGNMSASDFMYFTLGFIFYKYLSEKIEMYINGELEADEMTFKEAWTSDEQELKDEIREISMENQGYFIEPDFLYSSVIEAIKRKEIEKYSHLATLQEVADNDYNLNIPRYVDTFEEEEPIDIKAVMAEIKELEAKRAELDKEIEVYLKELGIV